jgi:hypothetical protein
MGESSVWYRDWELPTVSFHSTGRDKSITHAISHGSAGGLYSHTAAKILFLRIFRQRDLRHVHSHTLLGWSVWFALCFAAIAIAYVLAIAGEL